MSVESSGVHHGTGKKGIVAHWSIVDTNGLMKQLGAIPS
jgi:hypothetical protein